MSIDHEEQGGFNRRAKVLLSLTVIGILAFAYGALKISKRLELRAHGDYAMWEALRDETPERLRMLLKLGLDPNYHADNERLLVHAVTLPITPALYEKIDLLLDYGADPTLPNGHGVSSHEWLLYHAMLSDGPMREDRLRLDAHLVEAGATETPLSLILQERWDEARVAIESNPDLVQRRFWKDRTLLHWTAVMGNAEFATFLVESGADPTALDIQNQSAVIVSVASAVDGYTWNSPRDYAQNWTLYDPLPNAVVVVSLLNLIDDDEKQLQEMLKLRALLLLSNDNEGLVLLEEVLDLMEPMPPFEDEVLLRLMPVAARWAHERDLISDTIAFPGNLYFLAPELLVEILDSVVTVTHNPMDAHPLYLAGTSISPPAPDDPQLREFRPNQLLIIKRLLALGMSPNELHSNTPVLELLEKKADEEVLALIHEAISEQADAETAESPQ